MKLLGTDGRLLDADMDIVTLDDVPGAGIVMHSRAGGRESASARNLDYFEALETALRRLSQIPAVITRILVDSKPAQDLPRQARTLDLPYPIRLAEADDIRALRLQITNAQRPIGQQEGVKGGNTHKRIRIEVDTSVREVVAGLAPHVGSAEGNGRLSRSPDLAGLIAQWRSHTGYPTPRDEKAQAARVDMAPNLSLDGLDALATEPASARSFFNRFAATAYGSPGPQSTFNRSIQDDATLQRVITAARHLLHGEGAVEDRIDDVLERPDHAVPGLKEALIVKLLAVHDPARWFPGYVSKGAKGKLRAIEILGLNEPDPGATAGQGATSTNDTLNEALTPFLGEDAWAKQEFCFWLVKRSATPVPPEPPVDFYELSGLAGRLYVPETFLAKAIRLLEDRRQVVFYGPPGTGKTYVARELADHLAGTGEVVKVQFHPSYAYEDFVEGYRPRMIDGTATFELVDGPLKELARIAEERPDERHVLLIDEINRGNVAKILGELFFLLEYRDEEMRLQYSAAPFQLPENLLIIATMNTADRSIALVDAALRRRFHFVPFFPDAPPVEGLLGRWLADHRPEMAWVAGLVDRANAMLDDRHLAIGPSHFLRPDLDDEWLELVWEHSVLPYLAEQFFGDEDRLVPFQLDRLRDVSAAETPPSTNGEPSSETQAAPGMAAVDPAVEDGHGPEPV